MDAILDRPMENVLEALPLSSEVKSALLCQENLLYQFILLVLAHEKGEWHKTSALADKLRLSEPDIAEAYLECLSWTQKIFQLNAATSAAAARAR
jgi:EAL and modified HD-GYP domain-containing signal transduction protein